jgi:hypothetical protein
LIDRRGVRILAEDAATRSGLAIGEPVGECRPGAFGRVGVCRNDDDLGTLDETRIVVDAVEMEVYITRHRGHHKPLSLDRESLQRRRNRYLYDPTTCRFQQSERIFNEGDKIFCWMLPVPHGSSD